MVTGRFFSIFLLAPPTDGRSPILMIWYLEIDAISARKQEKHYVLLLINQ